MMNNAFKWCMMAWCCSCCSCVLLLFSCGAAHHFGCTTSMFIILLMFVAPSVKPFGHCHQCLFICRFSCSQSNRLQNFHWNTWTYNVVTYVMQSQRTMPKWTNGNTELNHCNQRWRHEHLLCDSYENYTTEFALNILLHYKQYIDLCAPTSYSLVCASCAHSRSHTFHKSSTTNGAHSRNNDNIQWIEEAKTTNK